MKEELDKMMNRSYQALNEATLLQSHQMHNACASRAYYAMFHAAEAVLKAKNLTTSSHNATLSLFGFHFVKSGLILPAYGKMFSNAFATRQQGDYDYDSEIKASAAEDILEKARDFVQTMESWLKNNNYL